MNDGRGWSERGSARIAIAALVVFVLALAFAINWVGFGDIKDTVSRLDMATLAALAASVAISLFARSLRMWWLLVSLGVRLPVSAMILIYFGANILSPTPARAGGIALRLWLLNRNWGVPYYCSAAVLSVEIASDIFCLLMVAVVSMAMLAPTVVAYLMVPSLIAVGLLIALSGWARRVLLVVFRRVGILKRIVLWLALSLRQIRRMPVNALLSALLLALVNRGVEIVGLMVVLNTLASGLTLLQAAAVYTAGVTAAYVSMSPGGLGSAELAITGAQLALGVDPATAIVSAVAFRTGSLWLALMFGFAAFPVALRRVGSG